MFVYVNRLFTINDFEKYGKSFSKQISNGWIYFDLKSFITDTNKQSENMKYSAMVGVLVYETHFFENGGPKNIKDLVLPET